MFSLHFPCDEGIIMSIALFYCWTIFLEPGYQQCGKAGVDIRSPVHSDEEYLSPQEEEMEVGDSSSLNKGIGFNEPPSFQVRFHIKLNHSVLDILHGKK